MTTDGKRRPGSAETPGGSRRSLRNRAEAQTTRQSAANERSPAVTEQLLHELQVHQIELEMQNEELRRAQEELEAARERYFDLYNLAPVGYLTVNERSLIIEANLTFATMLGVPRGTLPRSSFTRFVLPEDQDIYYRHRQRLFKTGEPQVCEMRMVRQGSGTFWARIEASAAQDGERAEPICRAVVSDITERRQAEAERESLLGSVRALAARLAEIEEATRAHLAQRLHDSIGQSLAALGIELQILHGRIPEDRLAALQPVLDRIAELLQTGIAELRLVMTELRPPSLDDLGLSGALRWLGDQLTRRTGLPVTMEGIEGVGRFSSSLEIALFRIAQEALTNIGKHSRACNVRISLQSPSDAIVMTIRDDGIGYDPDLQVTMEQHGHWGIFGMRERAEVIGASLSVGPGPDGGTAVVVRVPLPAATHS